MEIKDRYEVWKIELVSEGEWRWAIWDIQEKRVAFSGAEETCGAATKTAQGLFTTLMLIAELDLSPESSE